MLCPHGNDSRYFSSSLGMLRVKAQSELVSPAYFYWQIIILVVNRHLEGRRANHRMLLSLAPQLLSGQYILSVVILSLHSFFPDN